METLVLVQRVCGNEAVNRSNACRWYSRFRDRRELVEDNERGSRPKSTRTEVKIAAVADLVKNDRRIASIVRHFKLLFKNNLHHGDSEFLVSVFK
jgi:hypothetical protein